MALHGEGRKTTFVGPFGTAVGDGKQDMCAPEIKGLTCAKSIGSKPRPLRGQSHLVMRLLLILVL